MFFFCKNKLKYSLKIILPCLSVSQRYVCTVHTGVFSLKSIVITLTKFCSQLLERTNCTQTIGAIHINEGMWLLADGKAQLGIDNFMRIGRIAVIVYVHTLNEYLLPRISTSPHYVVFGDVWEFLRPAFHLLDTNGTGVKAARIGFWFLIAAINIAVMVAMISGLTVGAGVWLGT